jgi:hypothetical protein
VTVAVACYASPAVDTRYQRKLEAGLCTYGSCPERAIDGFAHCPRHQLAENKRKAAQRKTARQLHRINGRCGECGERKSETYRCAACEVRFQERPSIKARSTTNDATNVATAKAERIAAATRVHHEPATAGSRAATHTRYHGQNDRGPPSKAALDEQTLRFLAEEVAKAVGGLLVARSPAFADRPKSERRAAEREALSHVELARRLAEEVLDRNHYDDQIDRMVPG